MRLALYQPEIPQNVGTLIRLGACLEVPIDIVEPCGFVWQTAKLRRAGMDYLDLASVTRHSSWQAFAGDAKKSHSRLVLLDVNGKTDYLDFDFAPSDILIAGQESSGVPESVFAACDASVTIPMATDCRSLNVAVASTLVLGEALRQTSR